MIYFVNIYGNLAGIGFVSRNDANRKRDFFNKLGFTTTTDYANTYPGEFSDNSLTVFAMCGYDDLMLTIRGSNNFDHGPSNNREFNIYCSSTTTSKPQTIYQMLCSESPLSTCCAFPTSEEVLKSSQYQNLTNKKYADSMLYICSDYELQ